MFIPLLGTRLKDYVVLDKKNKIDWAVDIKFTSNHRSEILVFGSEKEK